MQESALLQASNLSPLIRPSNTIRPPRHIMMTGYILAESEHYVLRNQHESCELLHKQTKSLSDVGDHYGNPACGLIAPDETWCITGGEGLILWFLRGKSWTGFRPPETGHESDRLQFARPEDSAWLNSSTENSYQSVHDMKIETSTSVRILLDPWDDFASTWLLDVKTKSLAKLKDGPNLQDQHWTDQKIEF